MIRRIIRNDGSSVFYFHKTTQDDYENYHGSGKVWKDFIKHHGNPELLWVSEPYCCPITLQKVAIRFSIENDIVNSIIWANLKIENGLDGGCSDLQYQRLMETKSSNQWKVKQLHINQKISDTKNDPLWKETTGKEALRKIKETVNSSEWKASKGIERIRKQKECYSDSDWMKNVGLVRNQKVSDTKNDPLWKETIGSEAKQKELETKSRTDWQENVWTTAVEAMTNSVTKLRNRDNVVELRALAKRKKVKLGKGWPNKSDDWINEQIERLR